MSFTNKNENVPRPGRVLRHITAVQFGALTTEEWKKYAIEITIPYTRGGDIENTPYDKRLGALDNGDTCLSCGEINTICPGHFGYIDLGDNPVYNPDYLDYVVSILKCVCNNPGCYKPRISAEEAEWAGYTAQKKNIRLKMLRKKCEKLTTCPHCHGQLASYTEKNNIVKTYFDDKESAIPLTAKEALTALSQISNETMTLLGFNDGLSTNPIYTNDDMLPDTKTHMHQIRPEAFIFGVLPIVPPPARPWVIKNGEKRDDDLTERYNAILKVVNKLKVDRNAGSVPVQQTKGRKKNGKMTEKERNKAIEDLQNLIWTLMDNGKEKTKTSSGSRSHKGYRERLSGKVGYIQLNAAGKRVDFSARTVIVGGGPLLPVGWIGIPRYVAETLTVSEIVLDWNIEYYNKLLTQGKINVIKRQGNIINVKKFTNNFATPFVLNGKEGKLQLRDIIDRQLEDGDWGLFNRQPTLRIESMQGVQLKIFNELVFRLPLAMTPPFNADFDGDWFSLLLGE